MKVVRSILIVIARAGFVKEMKERRDGLGRRRAADVSSAYADT
jgi:hypothetical protein